MNKENLSYCPGTIAQRTDLSVQCVKIQKILLSEYPDHVKLHSMLHFLSSEKQVNADTLNLLMIAFRSHLPSKEGNIQVSTNKEMYFWIKLSEQFPANAELLLITAESVLEADDELDESIYYFLKAFELNPQLTRLISYNAEMAIFESEYRYCLMVYQLLNARNNHQQDELAELLINIHQEFGNDPDKMTQINDLLNSKSTNDFRCKQLKL